MFICLGMTPLRHLFMSQGGTTHLDRRSPSACFYCRSQKVKCSGGQPCAKCVSSRRTCVFPSRERVVTIPESYVRRLESEIAQLRQPSHDSQRVVTHTSDQLTTPWRNGSPEQGLLPERLFENSTTEHFVRKLKNVYSTPTQDKSGVSSLPMTSTPDVAEFPANNVQSVTSDYT